MTNLAVESDRDVAESLIDRYLRRQRELTPVENFSERRESGDFAKADRRFSQLIPLTRPMAGQQYAFEVDLDACSGCKACVTACHTMNGLDESEMWRGVGLLVGGTTSLPVVQHITSACHHCLEPACADGCPVLAYEKDPLTGIVRHLDDQCIGCQYCILKCPYDVPKYNSRLGIVRKCDMCSSRLEASEAPACVQGCPNEAIRIRIVNKHEILDENRANLFLPGAPDPDYTLPTTNYKQSRRPLPRNMIAADAYQIAPQHAHMPLVVMLVLTQLSVGAFVVGQIIEWAGSHGTSLARPLHSAVALTLGLLALGASTLHLGRPLYAFRAVLGLRTSWLSREIVTFALFALLATAYAICVWIAPTSLFNALLAKAVAVSGLLGVSCSVMIYHDTRRPFWHIRFTATKFFLSTLTLGISTCLLTAVIGAGFNSALSVVQALSGWGEFTCKVMAAATLLKIVFALSTFIHLRSRVQTPMKRTAQLGIGPLLRPTLSRLGLGLVGGVLLPLLTMQALRSGGHADVAILVVAAFALTLASELLERYLFFAAVVPPKMPGGIG